MNTQCIPAIPVLFYSCPCTVVIPCALRGTLLRCPVVRVFYIPWFPSRTYCIVIPLVLHSWSPWTFFYWYDDNDLTISTAADHGFLVFALSTMPMIILTMIWWWHDDDFYYYCRSWILLPDLSTTPMNSTRCRGDVFFDVATDVVFFTVPPGDVVVVAVLICCVCAPVQLRADEHLLHRWWVSRLQPL